MSNTRFKKGCIPWSKGTIGILKANSGSFKKGNAPWNKNKNGLLKHSEETRMKMSETHKRNYKNGIYRKKKYITSEETKEKLRIASIKAGCKPPPPKKGKDSPNWKGGITPLTEQIRKCCKYVRWHSDVFTRDNFTCQKCWTRSGNGKAVFLEAHHIDEFSKIFDRNKITTLEEALLCEEFWNINNGITLCKKCHSKTKKGRNLIN